MVDQQITPVSQPQVVQGSGNWSGYVGPGMLNLVDTARTTALNAAGLGMMAAFQNPLIYDAIQDRQKYVEAFSNPLTSAGLTPANLANVPLAETAARYGPNVANATQTYFTINPTQKAIDIVNAAYTQGTNIIGSSGIQRYIGTTPDRSFAVYSEAGGSAPFRANVLTEYQKGAVGVMAGATNLLGNAVQFGLVPAETARSAIASGITGIRGFESGAGLIASDFSSRFTPAPEEKPVAIIQMQQPTPSPIAAGGNFLTDFFGGFAKSGYAAGASAIQPFAGAREYTPVYETLMAAPKEERLVGGKTIASVGVTTPNYLVDSGEGIKAPFTSANLRSREQPTTPYTEQALGAVTERAGYTPLENLGDVRTQQITKGYELASKAFGLMGMNVASPDIITGRMLETQRQVAYATPTLTDDRFFGGELQKWAENKVELSSAYHDIGMVSGKPIAANPYEYAGDLAVEFLKGTPTRATEKFSPVSGELAGVIPAGGLQGYAWESALATDRGTAQPAKVSFMQGVDYLGASEGLMGPYGVLAGGTGAKYVTPIAAPESAGSGAYLTGEMRVLGGGERLVGGKTIAGSPTIIQSDAGIKEPFTSANLPKTTIEKPTGEIFGMQIPLISDALAFFQPGREVTTQRTGVILPESTAFTKRDISVLPSGAAQYTDYYTTTGGKQVTNNEIAKVTPSGLDKAIGGFWNLESGVRSSLNLPSVEEGETGIRLASLAFPTMGALTMPGFIETQLTGKTTTTEIFNPFAGQYKQFYEHPLLVPASYAVGAAFGTGAGVVSKGVSAVRGVGAEYAIGSGQTARAAYQFGDVVMDLAPKALGVLYAADVAGRATKGFTSFEPSQVAPSLRGIVMQETVPMGAGFALPGQVVNAARLSDIGYKSALQEGGVSGRLDYYTQPLTKPIAAERINYAAYLQEGGAPGLLQYAGEKIGFNRVPSAEPTTLNPAKMVQFDADIASAAYGKPTTIGDVLGVGKPVTPEASTFNLRSAEYESSFAYGKQPTIFEVGAGKIKGIGESLGFGKDVATVEPHPYSRYIGESKALSLGRTAYPEASEPIDIKLKAYFQENKPFEFVSTFKQNLIYPAKDIQNINAAFEFGRTYGDVRGVVGRSSLNIFGVSPSAMPTKYSIGTAEQPSVEIKGSGGMVSLARVETTSLPLPEVSQAQLPEVIGGLPMYPLAPSPKSRSYTIEEEMQYFTLPPGVTRPSPSKTTSPLSMISGVGFESPSMFGRAFATIGSPLSGLATSGATRSAQVQLQIPTQQRDTLFGQLTEQRRDQVRVPDFSTRFAEDIVPRFAVGYDVLQTPRVTTTTRQITTPETTIVPRPTIIPTPVVIPPPGLPGFPFGGGGDLGSTRKRRRYFKETFWMGLDVAGPIITPPKSVAPPKLKRSSLLGGKQKIRTPTRRKKR